jgi:aminoglycoside/choline kinase family phosphotransferase
MDGTSPNGIHLSPGKRDEGSSGCGAARSLPSSPWKAEPSAPGGTNGFVGALALKRWRASVFPPTLPSPPRPPETHGNLESRDDEAPGAGTQGETVTEDACGGSGHERTSQFETRKQGCRMKETLVQLFTELHGHRPDAILEMAADGSTRQYFRLVWGDHRTLVGAVGPDHEENRAFLSFARSFRAAGLPVPEIYAENQEQGVWLEEDLGDTTLFQALMAARGGGGGENLPEEVEKLFRKSLSVLPRFQVSGHRVVDYSVAYPRQAFDHRSIRWDLNYFKYHFLKLAHIDFSEQRLEDDFGRLTDLLLQADAEYFLYRDFQSRNIMIREGEPWFIDFQGGRKGALQYDVASLLYDSKLDLPDAARERLLDHYLQALGELVPLDVARFREQYRFFVLVRLMQALGAFGYRGFFERKRHFLESVPFAAKTLDGLLMEGLPAHLPELEAVFRRIAHRWARPPENQTYWSGMTVVIHSFSFRKGYPKDSEGHGGGFVFDCRSLPNPGRMPELSELSGEDDAVIDLLERSPKVREFFENVRGMVDMHLENYLSRAFDSLTVSFGCTGGRHRSVFMANKLADHLRSRFPHVEFRVTHREL